ncbi:MAG TPA: hypothetical protein G4O18_06675 [Dehalococcoidia bacterium]|nr:hypothetical protein [Dehalococcoidia bacterium]
MRKKSEIRKKLEKEVQHFDSAKELVMLTYLAGFISALRWVLELKYFEE